MKIEKEFILREIAGDYIIVPVGKTALEFNGMITVNETGAFLWELLEREHSVQSLVDAMTAEYEVDGAQAEKDINAFLDHLRNANALVEG